ncbi:MAG: Spy/CpxP family protein refolding chaperone [Spirochaetota bacterium]
MFTKTKCGPFYKHLERFHKHHKNHFYEHHVLSKGGFKMGGLFGIKRPVRHLAYKLELDDEQVKELARIINNLKTARAQHAVNEQRSLTLLAEAMETSEFGAEKAKQAAAKRSESSKELAAQVEKAVSEIHAFLNEGQRNKFAYLLRTGSIQI